MACDRNDTNFRMVTAENYFLAQEMNGEKHIISFSKDKINPNWASTEVGKIGDICGENNAYWVSDISDNRVIGTFYGKNSRDIKGYPTENVIPHILGVGDKYVLVGDSVNNKLLFMNKKNGKVEAIKTISKKPSHILYKFEKFYVAEENEIEVYDEQAIALRNTIIFRHNITHLQATPVAIFVNSVGNDTLFEANINIFENAIRTNLRKTYQQITYSPYNRVVFGTETEGNCILNKGKLILNNVPLFAQRDSISHLEMDFFQSNAFFQANNNFYQQNINDSIPSLYTPFTGKILKAVYRQDYFSEQ